MISGRIYPPWDEKTIAGLNRWQMNPNIHPFTCYCGANLVARREGWGCSAEGAGCSYGYTQDWAWAFMATYKPPR